MHPSDADRCFDRDGEACSKPAIANRLARLARLDEDGTASEATFAPSGARIVLMRHRRRIRDPHGVDAFEARKLPGFSNDEAGVACEVAFRKMLRNGPGKEIAGFGVLDPVDALPSSASPARWRPLDGFDEIVRRRTRRVRMKPRERSFFFEHPTDQPRAVEVIDPA